MHFGNDDSRSNAPNDADPDNADNAQSETNTPAAADPAGESESEADAKTGQSTPEIQEAEPVSQTTDAVREQLLDELRREQAPEEFQATRPDAWMQVERVRRIIDYQEEMDDECFPKGSCFVHVNLPDVSSLSLKRVMDICLQSCLVSMDIYEDESLEAGMVLVPLEGISWFGFPEKHHNSKFAFRGFTYGQIQKRE